MDIVYLVLLDGAGDLDDAPGVLEGSLGVVSDVPGLDGELASLGDGATGDDLEVSLLGKVEPGGAGLLGLGALLEGEGLGELADGDRGAEVLNAVSLHVIVQLAELSDEVGVILSVSDAVVGDGP